MLLTLFLDDRFIVTCFGPSNEPGVMFFTYNCAGLTKMLTLEIKKKTFETSFLSQRGLLTESRLDKQQTLSLHVNVHLHGK